MWSRVRSSLCERNHLLRRRGGGAAAEVKSMSTEQDIRQELDDRARQGDTVVPGGTGGKSLEAQEHLAQGRKKGGETRKEQLGKEGYEELGKKGGGSRKEQIGTEGYQEMGRKGGLGTAVESGGERATKEEGVPTGESKHKTLSD